MQAVPRPVTSCRKRKTVDRGRPYIIAAREVNTGAVAQTEPGIIGLKPVTVLGVVAIAPAKLRRIYSRLQLLLRLRDGQFGPLILS